MKNELRLDTEQTYYGKLIVVEPAFEFAVRITITPLLTQITRTERTGIHELTASQRLPGTIPFAYFYSDSSSLTLINLTGTLSDLIAEYTLLGIREDIDTKSHIDKISFIFDTITPWILWKSHFIEQSGGFTYDHRFTPTSTRIVSVENEITVSLVYHATVEGAPGNRTFDEAILISIDLQKEPTDLTGVTTYLQDFRAIFSGLVGTGVNATRCFVRFTNTSSGESIRIHFPTTNSGRNPIATRSALIHFNDLAKGELWGHVVTRYFENRQKMNKKWRALFVTLTYSGIWEYGIVGMLGTLEYVLRRSVPNSTWELKPSIKRNLKAHMALAFDDYWGKYLENTLYQKKMKQFVRPFWKLSNAIHALQVGALSLRCLRIV